MDWCGQYILGGEDGYTPIPCYSLLEWGRWLESADRCVGWTGSAHKWVSTVFLGLDHRHLGGGPPLVFESMVFTWNGDLHEDGMLKGHPKSESLDCVRYSSWDDAETGHKAMVRKYLIDQKTRVEVIEVGESLGDVARRIIRKVEDD